jgi:hypothetical protein
VTVMDAPGSSPRISENCKKHSRGPTLLWVLVLLQIAENKKGTVLLLALEVKIMMQLGRLPDPDLSGYEHSRFPATAVQFQI